MNNPPNNKHAKNPFTGQVELTYNDNRAFDRAQTLTLEDALDTIIGLQEKIRQLEYLTTTYQTNQWKIDNAERKVLDLERIIMEWDNKLFKVIRM